MLRSNGDKYKKSRRGVDIDKEECLFKSRKEWRFSHKAIHHVGSINGKRLRMKVRQKMNKNIEHSSQCS
jgi:hypothetical protein